MWCSCSTCQLPEGEEDFHKFIAEEVLRLDFTQTDEIVLEDDKITRESVSKITGFGLMNLFVVCRYLEPYFEQLAERLIKKTKEEKLMDIKKIPAIYARQYIFKTMSIFNGIVNKLNSDNITGVEILEGNAAKNYLEKEDSKTKEHFRVFFTEKKSNE